MGWPKYYYSPVQHHCQLKENKLVYLLQADFIAELLEYIFIFQCNIESNPAAIQKPILGGWSLLCRHTSDAAAEGEQIDIVLWDACLLSLDAAAVFLPCVSSRLMQWQLPQRQWFVRCLFSPSFIRRLSTLTFLKVLSMIASFTHCASDESCEAANTFIHSLMTQHEEA